MREPDSDFQSACSYNGIILDLNDVEDVFACVYGENDGADWHWIFKTKDQRIGYLRAGCDYTGWDCRSSADLEWFDSVDAAIAAIPEKEKDYNSNRSIRSILQDQIENKLPFGAYDLKF